MGFSVGARRAQAPAWVRIEGPGASRDRRHRPIAATMPNVQGVHVGVDPAPIRGLARAQPPCRRPDLSVNDDGRTARTGCRPTGSRSNQREGAHGAHLSGCLSVWLPRLAGRSPARASINSSRSSHVRSTAPTLDPRFSGACHEPVESCRPTGSDDSARAGGNRLMPRSRIFIAAALVLVVGIGGYVAWDQVLSGDSVAPLALPPTSPAPAATNSAVTDPAATVVADPAATANAGASSGPSATTDPVASTPPATAVDGDVAGTWTVAAGSQAGYRVRERLASLSAESDAVGRTSDINGSITIESDGTTTSLTAGTLTVDTTTITSDEGRRDNRMRSEGLQTDRFPTASFTITAPVEIPAAALAGTASDLTLRWRSVPAWRHEVGLHPGSGSAHQRHHRGRRLDHLPACRLRHRRAEHRWVHHLDRRRRRPRVPDQLHEKLTGLRPRPRLLRVDAAGVEFLADEA